jgi:hypothetical protein
LAALKNETALANVSGVVDFDAGAPHAMKLPVSRLRHTKLMALTVFIFRYGVEMSWTEAGRRCEVAMVSR